MLRGRRGNSFKKKTDTVVKKFLQEVDDLRQRDYGKSSLVALTHEESAEVTLRRAREWDLMTRVQAKLRGRGRAHEG